jgi:hypothetical protein
LNKPKLVLHIGHGKTGTTSIQYFCIRHHDKLKELGYLYPIAESPRHNHPVVMGGFVEKEKLNVIQHQVYEGSKDKFMRDFDAFWSRLQKDINRYQPHTVILSAEQLFRDFTKVSRIPFSSFLNSYFSEVSIVAYIRSPVKDYVSRVAQRIRVGRDILSPQTRKFKKVLSYYESQFPGHVHLRVFDRSEMVGGDVVKDFLFNFAPDATELTESSKNKLQNTSLSWNMLRVLRQARIDLEERAYYPSKSTRMLMAYIPQKYSNVLPKDTEKPTLKPEYQHWIEGNSEEYQWLKDKYGLVFSDYDYELSREPVVRDKEHVDIEDIFEFSEPLPLRVDVDWVKKGGLKLTCLVWLFMYRQKVRRLLNLYRHDIKMLVGK